MSLDSGASPPRLLGVTARRPPAGASAVLRETPSEKRRGRPFGRPRRFSGVVRTLDQGFFTVYGRIISLSS